jgi:ribosome recycling factor
MTYDFTAFTARVGEIEEWLKKELASLRTGRATQAVLDSITVDAYGAQSPLAHVATISIEDARTIRISPWDRAHVKAIDASIQKADLGLSVSVDDHGLRVIFPELTGERRTQIVKLLKERLEEARVTLRKEREGVLGDLKKNEKEGSMSEDEHFRAKEELQKFVDAANERFDALAAKKETEIQA